VGFDGVFLDMYGTLTTGDRAAVESVCAEVIAETALPLSARELSLIWGERFFHAMDTSNDDRFETLFEVEVRTLRETMTALERTVDADDYVTRLTAYWRDPPLQPEVPEFLATFPLPVWIVSNADRADLDAALRRHSIEVAGVITSEDVRSYKPAPRIFHEALARSGWRPQRVIHVGDSLHSDVGGARAVGLRSGWVNRIHRIHDVGNHTPDHEFADLLELTALVRQIQAA
jgi:2-haloacid dehalogenase/putative hydrolase of the HAD superfamily